MRWLILALALMLPLPAAAQDDDRGILTRLLEDNLSGAGRAVRIEGFEGALSATARIRALTIADDRGIWIALRGVELQWNRAALFRGRIEVERLVAAEIDVIRPPESPPGPALPAPEATPFALPELPVAVQIGTIAAARVTLGAAILGEPVALRLAGTARLEGGAGEVGLEAQRIDDRRDGLRLAGAYSNRTRILTLDLAATEAPGGLAARALGIPGAPALDLAVAGTGPIDGYTARVRLAADGRERLAGTLALRGPGFAVDVAGDIAPLFLPDYRAFFGDSLALTAAGSRSPVSGALTLDRLELRSAQVALAGSGRLGPDGLPERLALDLRIAAGDGGPVLLPIPGDPVRVGGAELSLAFDPAADEGWRIAGRLDALDAPAVAIDRVTLDGSGRIARQPGGTQAVGGTLRYAATGLSPRDAGLAQALGAALSGGLRFAWLSGGALQVSDLTLAGEGLSVRTAFSLSAADRPAVDGRLAAEIADFARLSGLAGRPLGGAGRLALAGKAVPLDGTFDARLDVTGTDLRSGIAELDALLAGAATVALDAARDTTGTTVRALALRAATLALDAAGTIRTGGSDFTATARFDDLAVLGAAYGGALAADLRLTQAAGTDRLTLTGTARDLAVGQQEIDGLMRGMTDLAVTAAQRDGVVTLEALRIDGPAIAARAAGTATPGAVPAADLTLAVTLPDLARLGPPWGGTLDAEARLTARDGREALTLAATATDLRTGVAEADGLLRGPVRLEAAAARTEGTITLDRLALNGQALRAAVTGSLSEALTTLAADLTLPDLSAAGPSLGGSLTGRATLRIAGGTEAATLDARAQDLRLGRPEADRLLAGPATLAVAARRTDGVIRLDRLRLDGRQVTAEATGQSDGARSRAALTARLADLGLIVPGVPGPLSLTGTIDADTAGYGLDFALRGPGGIDATARGRIAADLARADLRAAGGAEAALANTFIAPASVRGPVRFDLALNGPLTPEALGGRVSLSGARVAVTGLPFALADTAATVTLGGGRAQIDASARSETGGTVILRGPVALAAPHAAGIETRFTAFGLRDPNLYATTLSGAVRIEGPLAGGARIGGALNLGPTELRIPASSLGGAAAIPDLRHLSEPPAVRATRARAGLIATGPAAPAGGRGAARPYPLDLAIEAGRIFVRGRGLDAELGGTLALRGTTAAPVPVGGFALVRGRLDLLGKRFDLGAGKLLIEGDFVPRLELAATAVSDDITATIAVEGRADEPEIRFRSAPELPEEEVVARLLFGRGLQSLSAFQAAQLALAVATLTGRGGVGLVDRLRQSFGLDDFDVQTGSDGAAAFRAGKYIAENVYADVVFGARGKTEVTLNLDVSPSVTVRGRAASDGTTGIGVFFERDY